VKDKFGFTCVECQFINLQLCSEWMQLQPEVIYLTGGASANGAIAQVAADVFQADVERLSVGSSVALRAARCQPEPSPQSR
jgi:xylulokinase